MLTLTLSTCAGDTLLHEAVSMSSKVGLVKPNDHIVVVQMISDSLVVKVEPFSSWAHHA